MKWFNRISVGILTILAGCRQSSTTEAPAFLPGIYMNQSENEFCRIADTFTIRKNKLDGDGFRVLRNSSFQRIRHGEKLPLEFQTEQWMAVYDGSRKVLKATESGKELQYEPVENKIYTGNVGYVKVE